MKMTYFKWSLTCFVRLLIRVFFLGPIILLTVIPANIYDWMQNLDYKLSNWWIE